MHYFQCHSHFFNWKDPIKGDIQWDAEVTLTGSWVAVWVFIALVIHPLWIIWSFCIESAIKHWPANYKEQYFVQDWLHHLQNCVHHPACLPPLSTETLCPISYFVLLAVIYYSFPVSTQVLDLTVFLQLLPSFGIPFPWIFETVLLYPVLLPT